MIDDVSKTASDSWSRTKQALNPMRLAPSNLFAPREPAAPTAAESPGFFSSLFQPAGHKQPPKTVNDFLEQSKPNP